jgi:DNA repair exonuclease SbcCD ATPase subunit
MNWASDEMLAERRLRSSELALETTRQRLVEANEEIARLHARILELEDAFGAARDDARSLGKPEVIRRELAREQARTLAFEQALADERDRRHALERELEISRAPWSDTAEHELFEAQRRAERLEGELEVVRRHAAEFEQSIRVAVDDAWAWLAQVHGRLTLALEAQAELAERAGAGRRAAAGGAAPIDASRLDQARSRLREGQTDSGVPAMVVAPPARGPLTRLLHRRRDRS